jgi:hypothetical protein
MGKVKHSIRVNPGLYTIGGTRDQYGSRYQVRRVRGGHPDFGDGNWRLQDSRGGILSVHATIKDAVESAPEEG